MIPYYRPWTSGDELQHIATALQQQGSPASRHYTLACEQWLEARTGSLKAYLTPSCTAALEMAAILANIQAGDEIIMSSFTFPAMANAFVARGGIPVFVDIRTDTLNIDEEKIAAAITGRTRAIVVMHYGGVACEMDSIMALAQQHKLIVIEDAAHSIGASYKGRALGSIGHLATFSFHQTKNLQCGEGGALLVNDSRFLARAAIIRENGTDKTAFLQQKSSRYTWLDLGSSFIISEFSAAFLWAQIQHFDFITQERRQLWQRYQEQLRPADQPPHEHNAHIFYLVAESFEKRQELMQQLSAAGIQATSHYQPLHSADAGRRFGKTAGDLPHTDMISSTLLRLPLWVGLERGAVDHICSLIPAPLPAATLRLAATRREMLHWESSMPSLNSGTILPS